ncbi:MAG TPA: hypothetical protein VNW99_07890, partial [Cytophagaceae bacterium]|nr:hypothetical protein [Cytophagaceae bacterium]
MEAKAGRRVRSGDGFKDLFPPPTGNDTVIKKSANVSDTVKFIQEKAPETVWQTKRFARYIKGKTLDETCSNIWHWLYEHIPYKKDEEGVEQIRSPRRTVYEGSETGVDCDCYTFTISSTLLAMNPPVPHKYRITKYLKKDGSAPYWQHIYIVVPKNGRLDHELKSRDDYIVIDCVKDAYDEEEPYLEFKDYNATMRLDYLDGIDGNEEEYQVPKLADAQGLAEIYEEEELGKIGQWIKKAAKKVEKGVVKIGGKVLKASIAPFRAGFLLAMKENIFNIAKRIRYAYLDEAKAQSMGMNMMAFGKLKKIMDKVEKVYADAGGKKENLKKAILAGRGNKDRKVELAGLFGTSDEYADQEEYNIIHGITKLEGLTGLGVLPAVIAPAVAALTAVAKVLGQVKDLFPKSSSGAKEMSSDTGSEADGSAGADAASTDTSTSTNTDNADEGNNNPDNSATVQTTVRDKSGGNTALVASGSDQGGTTLPATKSTADSQSVQ